VSLTAIVWVVLAVVFAVGALKRPVWAVALYFLTFFLAPHLWWWGDQIPSARYALYAGWVLIASVTMHSFRSWRESVGSNTFVMRIALLLIANATFVHLVFASNPDISLEEYTEYVKFTLLYFLLDAAIQTRADFRTTIMVIALGAGYIGYEVTINERGDFNGARLEGVGAPGADTSNGLASLMLVTLPLTGTLFIGGTIVQRATLLLSAPLVLNVAILCNSRGAFLGMIAAAFSFVLLARGASRKKAIRAAILGGVLLYLLLGDPEILERFSTTFVGSEERDASASSRIEFWKAGLAMLEDYPFGAGGGAFKYVHATRYLAEVGSTAAARALHNGYLTDATDWGIQGLLLKLLFVFGAIRMAHKTSSRCRKAGREDDALIGTAVIAAMIAMLVCCIFGSYLSNEWVYWTAAFLTTYSRLYDVDATTAASATKPVVVTAAQARLESVPPSPHRPAAAQQTPQLR
jgi:hypothetical protein